MNNKFIKQVAHTPKPVSIERDFSDVVVIEGVRYAGDLFREFAFPSLDVLYAIRRDDDNVSLTVIRNADDANKFFEEIGQEPPSAFGHFPQTQKARARLGEEDQGQEQGDEDVV